MARRWAFLDHPGPIPFAHRGGGGEHPENTLVAFGAAIALGYRYLETDVRVTADGVLLAFHDHELDRVTDRSGVLEKLPWSEVREARIGGEPIPLVDDVLGEWPEARVNIDPKQDAAVAPLVEALRRTAAFDRVCVAAFSDRRLAAFRRQIQGRVCTGTGPLEIARLRMAGFTVRPGTLAAGCVQMPTHFGGVRLLDRRFLATAHRASLPVHIWTVNDEPEMERLLDLGVDGIMTDRPAVLKEVLERRGLWT